MIENCESPKAFYCEKKSCHVHPEIWVLLILMPFYYKVCVCVEKMQKRTIIKFQYTSPIFVK